MPKRSYTVSVDDFMGFWDKVENKPEKIIPNLTQFIKQHWKEQITARFNEYKRNRTFGPISMQQLAQFAQMFASPIRGEDYSDKYIASLPRGSDARVFTFVKTGELRQAMNRNQPYVEKQMGSTRTASVKIVIPFKTKNFPGGKTIWESKKKNVWERGGSAYNLRNTYRMLETKRSFVKGSFLQAWPYILNYIMDRLKP